MSTDNEVLNRQVALDDAREALDDARKALPVSETEADCQERQANHDQRFKRGGHPDFNSAGRTARQE